MSSDPFADLARSLTDFARTFRDVITAYPLPASGSPAEREADGEPFAGDWAEYPSRDIFATTCLAVTSCTDHLLAIASVLSARISVFAAYTLTRAAADAAAIGCYLTDKEIDGRERLRRTMNYRLSSLCEQVWMQAAQKEERVADFARSATANGFVFHRMDGRGRAAYLDRPQPSAMQLMSRAVDEESPDVGVTYQRLLSAVAHSGLHGLARLLSPVAADDGRPGEALAAVNLDPQSLALELVVGPMTAHSLAAGIEWFGGSDMSSLYGLANRMLLTWARVAQLEAPGSAHTNERLR
jgi:hypothetical protein